ncbi:MAG: hypothetical protein LUD51_01370 [Clostridia bacterium]|nr:hypothetical protein [Clostridia bacterium]
MLIEDAIKKATKVFLENPYWKEQYDKAPSELSRQYQELTFYFSENCEQIHKSKKLLAEYNAAKQDLEKKMGLEDWKYLYKYSGHNPFRTKCIKKIEELKAKQSKEQHDGIQI